MSKTQPRDRARAPRSHLTALAAALACAGLHSLPAFAGPEGASVRAGSATIQNNGAQTRIDQTSNRAVIDWRAFSVGAGEQVLFVQPSAHSVTLNRVTGEQLSIILGRMDANGQVFLVNPNGIVFGQGAQVNVGGLVASTANIDTADFMAGRLEFREPGRPGAGIVNEGLISAADGGLVALVAPHVRNDGVIQARLGKVALGAGDTFTLDLYGDGLLSLAVDPSRVGPMIGADGQAVTSAIAQAGRIEADGGRVVLVSAATARAALDQVINLSGTVRADSVQQQGGRILLVAAGGTAEVSGTLSVQGANAGESGGRIEVLGEHVRLAPGARVDASGSAGGGAVHLGGDWQGRGDTPRASTTQVAAGASIAADARAAGSGGEVVVWSDGATAYAGSISARGGAAGGDGGRVEVSGRRTLEFAGAVDAGASAGAAGSMLLDPETIDLGATEAALIGRVLRTGTQATVSAALDINVNALIDGRGGASGGGLSLTAGRDINLGQSIITADGAVSLIAGIGTVRFGDGRGVFAGSAPISLRAGADLATGTLVTGGALHLASTGGSIDFNAPLGATLGPISATAARDVRINQPVASIRNGGAFTVSAGGDLIVNAQIDGREGAATSGAVDLSAGGSVRFNQSVITQGAGIRVRATEGSIETASGSGLYVLGNEAGAIDLSAGGNLTTWALGTTGAVNLTAIRGAVTVGDGVAAPVGDGIPATVGAVTIRAGTDVNLDAAVLSPSSGAALSVNAGGDIHVRAPIDARAGRAAGGAVTLAAGRNVDIQHSITTRDGAITVTAAGGTVTQAPDAQLRAGTAPIEISAQSDLTSGSYVTTGALQVRSTAGSLSVAESIYDTTGATTLAAAQDVTVQPGARIENVRTGSALGITAGRDIIVNGQIGVDRDASTASGAVTLTAARSVVINRDVVTRDAPLTITASTGTVSVAPQASGPSGPSPQVRAGSGAISVTAGADLFVGTPGTSRPGNETPYVTSGTLSLSSTTGTLFIEAPIPATTGRINLNGGLAVQVNERVHSNGQDITVTAGPNGIHMSRGVGANSEIDARQGQLTLTAVGDIEANMLRTLDTLIVTSTAGQILSGTVLSSRDAAGNLLGMPPRVRLAAARGITGFGAAGALDVEARSSQGSIANLDFAGNRLYVDAAGDVQLSAPSGNSMELVSGATIRLNGASGGQLRLGAALDAALTGSMRLEGLQVSAGQNILITGPAGAVLWIDGPSLGNAAGGAAAVQGLSLSAGGDLSVGLPTHVQAFSQTSGAETGTAPTALSAGRNLSLGPLETLGNVTLSATNGSITVTAPIGVHVSPGTGFWNPTDLGVASLVVTAPGAGGAISLQGARARGGITINGRSINSPVVVTSDAGPSAVSLNAATINVGALAIDTVPRIFRPTVPQPAIPPGPSGAPVGGPSGPTIPSAPSPGAPGLPEVLVSVPSAIDAGARPVPGFGGAQGDGLVLTADVASRLLPLSRGENMAEGGPPATDEEPSTRALLVYAGGRGEAQNVDLGRSGSFGSARAATVGSEQRKGKTGAGKR